MGDAEFHLHIRATDNGREFQITAIGEKLGSRTAQNTGLVLLLDRAEAELLLEKLTCALCENPEIKP